MIRCPACQAVSSTVINSRRDDDTVKRRRECTKCAERWSTYEVSEAAHQAVTECDAILSRAQEAVRKAIADLAVARADARLVAEDYDLKPIIDGSPISVSRS